MKCFDSVYWYEDSEIFEYYIGSLRKVKKTTLKEACEFARRNKLCLCIQPEYQDSILTVDYSI